MKKNLLRKLTNLNTETANKQLAVYADKIFTDIKTDESKIQDSIELLEQFVFAVPDKAIEIFDYLVFEKKMYESKALEFLTQIRYFKPKIFIQKLVDLNELEETNLSVSEIDEAFRKFVEFNLGFIKAQKNYLPQEISVEFFENTTGDFIVRNFNLFLVLVKEVLSTEIEGTEWTDEKTLSFSHGTVDSNYPNLPKMRERVLEMIEGVISSTNLEQRTKLVMELKEASRLPERVLADDALVAIVKKDIEKLSDIFRSMAFSEQGVISEDLHLVQDIQSDLIWVIQGNLSNEKTLQLFTDIRSDKVFSIYNALVGDESDYRDPNEDWEVARVRKAEHVKSIVDEISDVDYQFWFDVFNLIATQYKQNPNDEWKFLGFKNVIENLALSKPDLIHKMMLESLNKEMSLSHQSFVSAYLSGLRRNKDIERWQEVVDFIIAVEKAELASSVVFSMNLNRDIKPEEYINESDILILDEIVKSSDNFSFVQQDDRLLRFAIINTLLFLLNSFKDKVEDLIIYEIENNPEFRSIYMNQLPHFAWRKGEALVEWSEEGVSLLKRMLIEEPDLGWHVQEMLVGLSKANNEILYEVLYQRIKLGEPRDRGSKYRAIPFEIYETLKNALSSDENFVTKMAEWSQEMSDEWSTFNWDFSHLIQNVGGKSMRQVVLKILEEPSSENINKVYRIINSMTGVTDLDLVLEVIKLTDDVELHKKLGSSLWNTGTVNGEYGIADAHERRAVELEKYIEDEDARVSKFAKEMSTYFHKSAENERRRADEEEMIRKKEFES